MSNQKKLTKKQIHNLVDYSIKKHGKAYKMLEEYDMGKNKLKEKKIEDDWKEVDWSESLDLMKQNKVKEKKI